MLRTLSTAAGLLGLTLAAWSAHAAPPFELKSVSVDLPDSDRMFPGGPEADAINNNCLACHSAGMVLTQPTLSEATWTAEVNKMINTYKAPVAPEDVGAIIAYLTKLPAAK
jgi:hypothetical protein